MTSTELETMTEGEVEQPDFTREEAEAITARIAAGATVIMDLVAEAYERRAWSALGYESWDDYLDGALGSAPLALPREKRKEAVVSLRGRGLSLRAIASATGTNHQTVANDLADAKADAEAAAPAPPAVEELDSMQAARLSELLQVQGERPLTYEEDQELLSLEAVADPQIVEAEIVEEEKPAEKIVGLDGKPHPVTKPDTKPKAAPQPAVVKQAKKVAKLMQSAQELYNDLLTDPEYISASKDVKTAVAEALAQAVNDLLDEFEIKVPAKWLKLVQ